MRFFRATPERFKAFRDILIAMLGLPSNGTTQPWDEDITHLALAPHEYQDARYAPMIAQALADGAVTEITEEEYRENYTQSEP